MPTSSTFERAARAISQADVLVIAAGAGMGVDSGLPDFRGDEGFWKAYPPMRHLNLGFRHMANGMLFAQNPELAWGFYGHRLNLYRATTPHAGFDVLRAWSRQKSRTLIYTSNVDGAFQRAGFDERDLLECHGSIHHLQCNTACHNDIWFADPDTVRVHVDESTFLAQPPLPSCPSCGGLARPNILMFNDPNWLPKRSFLQEKRLFAWLEDPSNHPVKGVTIEMGAGTAIPSVRRFSESLLHHYDWPLVRINPRESHGPEGTISIDSGAKAALQRLADITG